MAAKKKTSIAKKLTIVGILIILLQIGVMFYLKSQAEPAASNTISAAINKEVLEIDDPRKREIRRIQLSVRSFQLQKGSLPKKLDELVPVYLERVPLDPFTNKPFLYEVNGSKFSVKSENMEAMTEAGPGKKNPKPKRVKEKEEETLLASIDASVAEEAWVYDPTEKRDPFLPFDASLNDDDDDENKTPLERLALSQLKLTAVLKGFNTPTAIVEESGGKGFTIRKGTKIGRNNGEVIEIKEDRLVILEVEKDFSGEIKNRTVELKLRSKDQKSPR
jgi:Tfp pilus assembly protein PilP